MAGMNILSFGAGAIGTYIGGSLALNGNHLTFLEQPKAVAELHKQGLHLVLPKPGGSKQESEFSSFTVPPASFFCASNLGEALKRGPFDIAIFALKSFDTAAALEGLKPYANKFPPILCLSNGVENEPAIAAVLGADKVIAGTVTSSIGRRAVGDITLERLRGIGLADGHPLSLFLAEEFTAAGLNTRLFRRAADMKWSKMLTNLHANSTTAILNLTALEVFTNPGLFQLEMRLLREALAVMRVSRVRVVDLPGVPVRALVLSTHLPEFIARPSMLKAVGGGRGAKMPSFHIDLYSGRGRSEVEWLNGAVVRFGEKVGVPAPVNKLLTEILMALTRAEIPLDTYARQPGKLLEEFRTILQ
jgi:2-dehydropantoate 2-reductase